MAHENSLRKVLDRQNVSEAQAARLPLRALSLSRHQTIFLADFSQ